MPITIFVGLIVFLLHGSIIETRSIVAANKIDCEEAVILIQKETLNKGYVTLDKNKIPVEQIQGHCDKFTL